MKKKYTSAPLPFQGQKRNFIKQFKTALEDFPKDSIYIDLFGGSGLLSHTVKQYNQSYKVIYNDYDNFKERLKTVSITNKLLEELRLVFKSVDRKSKVNIEIKNQALEVIKNYESKGFVDFVTISSSLLFSMNYVTSFEALAKQTFYNNIRKSNYSTEGYLEGVEFVSCDYKALFEKYKSNPKAVFLVDPPYLSTDCSTYKNYWKLSDYLDVFKSLTKKQLFLFHFK